MTGKQLYEKYAGRQAQLGPCKGYVCGYDVDSFGISTLVMCIITGEHTGWYLSTDSHDPSARVTRYNAKIVTHKNNGKGYLWISEHDILPKKVSLWKRIMKRFWGK